MGRFKIKSKIKSVKSAWIELASFSKIHQIKILHLFQGFGVSVRLIWAQLEISTFLRRNQRGFWREEKAFFFKIVFEMTNHSLSSNSYLDLMTHFFY